jgi:hypothetical protein
MECKSGINVEHLSYH